MNRVAKGIVCGAAGLSAVALGFEVSANPEPMNEQTIEACAASLAGHQGQAVDLPRACDSIRRVFDITMTTVMREDDYSGGVPVPRDAQYFLVPTPEDFKVRAHDRQVEDSRQAATTKILSVILAGALSGGLLITWGIQSQAQNTESKED